MDSYIVFFIIVSLAVLVLLPKLITKTKQYRLQKKKINHKTSVVFVTKNNEKLIQYAIKVLQENHKDIDEYVILDLSSVDKTMEVARMTLPKDKSKIVDISRLTLTKNYFDIVSDHISGELVFLLDLHKINTENPNVYVPDLFKPLNTVLKKGLINNDTRIDGVKLLLFDKTEREKNSYILQEYIGEILSNVHMQIEAHTKKFHNDPDKMKQQLEELQKYIGKSTKNISKISRLIGNVDFSDNNLTDNMLNIFNDYSRDYNISVNYAVVGNEKEFVSPINELIAEITQDLLYTIVNYNLTSGIDVKAYYKNNKFQLLLKYDSSISVAELTSSDSGLSYYVLNSIQNRLNLLGGGLKITIIKDKIAIIVNLPITESILASEREA